MFVFIKVAEYLNDITGMYNIKLVKHGLTLIMRTQFCYVYLNSYSSLKKRKDRNLKLFSGLWLLKSKSLSSARIYNLSLTAGLETIRNTSFT